MNNDHSRTDADLQNRIFDELGKRLTETQLKYVHDDVHGYVSGDGWFISDHDVLNAIVVENRPDGTHRFEAHTLTTDGNFFMGEKRHETLEAALAEFDYTRSHGCPPSELKILSGSELPTQLHLGPSCHSEWINAKDREAGDGALCVKPIDALWTSPQVSRGPHGAATPWTSRYYDAEYDLARREKMSRIARIRSRFQPERLWPVTPTDEARVLHLTSVKDLVAVAERWPTEHGQISFEAMAHDGIDAVWVSPEVIPTSWSSQEWKTKPYAAVAAQFYGWETESIAWLRPDNITIGTAHAVDHTYRAPRPNRGLTPKSVNEPAALSRMDSDAPPIDLESSAQTQDKIREIHNALGPVGLNTASPAEARLAASATAQNLLQTNRKGLSH